MLKHRRLLFSIISLLAVAIMAPAMLSCANDVNAAKPTATISNPAGEVLVQKQGSITWLQAVSGMKLNEGDRLKTGGNSTTEVVFFEGSVIEVGADSEILLSEMTASNSGSTSIHLNQLVGHTVSRVHKLVDSASDYEVDTPAGSAVVRGTAFKSDVRTDGFTVIYCDEGTVWFTAGGKTVILNAGESASAMPGGTPSTLSAFHIENVTICSDVRGDRNYTVRPSAVFASGEKVWIYFEATSLEANASNGKYEVWYRATNVKVYDPNGSLYLSGTEPIDFHRTQLDTVPPYLWGALFLDPVPDSPPGQYKVDLAFQDVLSGKTDSITVYFTLSS
jgi:hypothetical protein